MGNRQRRVWIVKKALKEARDGVEARTILALFKRGTLKLRQSLDETWTIEVISKFSPLDGSDATKVANSSHLREAFDKAEAIRN